MFYLCTYLDLLFTCTCSSNYTTSQIHLMIFTLKINKKKAVEGSDKSKDGATPSLQSEVITGNDKQIDELLGMTA